jgi:YD repeat-containing protein
LSPPTKPKEGYLRRRGWKDLIFLGVVLIIARLVDPYLPNHLTDFEKWQARPKLKDRTVSAAQPKPGLSGLPPCFFFVPPDAVDQKIVSGSVGDCLLLIPDGTRLDLFEVPLGGALIPVETDLYRPDTIPLAFTRTYRRLDDWAKRNRIFLPHVYDPFYWGDRFPYGNSTWFLPDGQEIHFQRISPGIGFADAVAESTSTSPTFESSRINWNGWGWDLTLEDGTTYISPEAYSAKRPQQGSLVAIFDRNGNEVRLIRQSNGDLTEIKSPNGRWIRLSYSEGQVSRATDDSGNAVDYGYDPRGRLVTVKSSLGPSVRYSYNSDNQLTEVDNSSGKAVLQARYDSSGEVTKIIVGEYYPYTFRFAVDRNTKTGHSEVIDPKGHVTRVILQLSSDESVTSYSIENAGLDTVNP